MGRELEYLVRKVNKISKLDIRKDTREREYVFYRALYYMIAKDLTPYTNTKIANYVNRDHVAVYHAVNNIWPHIVQNEKEIYEQYIRIVNNISVKQFNHIKRKQAELALGLVEEKLKKIKQIINNQYYSYRELVLYINNVLINE
jgi:hypothetical protein